jgi:membrane carboxypeptidase/penicillin-binding protein PbpC
VKQHLGTSCKPEFFKDIKAKKKNRPFDFRVSQEEIEVAQILNTAMKRSVRYKVLTGKRCGNCERPAATSRRRSTKAQAALTTAAGPGWLRYLVAGGEGEEIPKVFDTPDEDARVHLEGRVDTVMSPMDSIRYYKSFLQSGLLSMDPHTGFVKAWVGGIDFKHFQYDHVEQARRQVGSTFKPFRLRHRHPRRHGPCREVPNQKVCFDMPPGQPDWCPENSDAKYGGMVTLEVRAGQSMNTVTAWLMKQYGPQAVTVLARHMGVKSPLEAVPSLCLGVADLTLMEMTGAFSTFANQGRVHRADHLHPHRGQERQHRVRCDPEHGRGLDERTAYKMLDMLKGVTDGAYNPSTSSGGHRHAPAHGLGQPRQVRQHQVPHCGQDRHHAEQQRRLVHRHHARSGDRCVDRCGRPQRALQPAPTRARALTWPCPSMATT